MIASLVVLILIGMLTIKIKDYFIEEPPKSTNTNDMSKGLLINKEEAKTVHNKTN